jgi:hypothetical protein
MDAIQAALSTRLSTPAGIATGEVPVWNGSTWVRSSVLGLAPSGISGYPNSPTKFLRGDGAWSNSGFYRKTTAKQVVNSVVETDLLNGEITVAAGLMGTTGLLRLVAIGDWINNTGAALATPRIKLKFGATTLIDTNVIAALWVASAGRPGWKIEAEIGNLGAANSQYCTFVLSSGGFVNSGSAFFTTGQGTINGLGGGTQLLGAGGNTSTEDTTAAKALALTVTLPTANALEDMTLRHAVVEII